MSNKIKIINTSPFYCKPVDIYAESRRSGSITAGVLKSSSFLPETPEITLDFESILPFAAKELDISSDIKDYMLWPVIMMTSDLPNRNGVAFPLKELVRWNPERGAQSYKTWNGMGLCVEHANGYAEKKDPAFGLIADTHLSQLKGYSQNKLWKVVAMMALDRTKDLELTEKILSGQLNSTSMGAYTQSYSCGYCGAEFGQCDHLNTRASYDFYELLEADGSKSLVFRNVHGISAIENSFVHDPAYRVALFDSSKPQTFLE